MAEPAPYLRAVPDPTTGEVGCMHHMECEQCKERMYAQAELEKKYTGSLAVIGKLKEDEEKKARLHRLWDEGLCSYEWWKLACWHPNSTFKAQDFLGVRPRLEERAIGLHGVLQAIAGAAFDPMEVRMKNGHLKKHDSFELLTRSEEKTRDFMERVPGGDERDEWKAWLVNLIEERFK
jgi:hypothetical protein